jgi:predicted DNA binding CopG/RHH family protein
MKNINVRMAIPEDIHRKIKVTAAQHGMNIADAINMILQKYYEMSERQNEEDRT